MVAELKLTKDQAQNVNKILRRYQREFTTLERRHTERSKNAAGHVIVDIKPFPQEMDQMMNLMWTDLATVLSAGQLAAAKTMHFERYFPHTGKKPVSVEIWEEENGQFHYVESQEPARKNRAAERTDSFAVSKHAAAGRPKNQHVATLIRRTGHRTSLCSRPVLRQKMRLLRLLLRSGRWRTDQPLRRGPGAGDGVGGGGFEAKDDFLWRRHAFVA